MKNSSPERPSFEAERRINFALKLDASNPAHLGQVIEIIRRGGIVALPFNGIYGLFGKIDSKEAAEEIRNIKGRPEDKKLIAVSTPETIHQWVDPASIRYPMKQIVKLWTDVHALGIILPASIKNAPNHLTVGEGSERTILTIWTEYPPLRSMVEGLHALGERGLVGTSANTSGEPTHIDPGMVYLVFGQSVEAVVYDRFDHLPVERRKSTTVIDLTGDYPRLHREGSVGEDELRQALIGHGFPELIVGSNVITVRGRNIK